MHADTPTMLECSADAAHGARFTVDGAVAFIMGRRRAALVAALAEGEAAGVELYALDVAAIEAAGIELQPIAAGHYVAAAPIAGHTFVRLPHPPVLGGDGA